MEQDREEVCAFCNLRELLEKLEEEKERFDNAATQMMDTIETVIDGVRALIDEEDDDEPDLADLRYGRGGGGMNMESRMYKGAKTWNPFKGCLFDCSYCRPTFKAQAKRPKCENCSMFRTTIQRASSTFRAPRLSLSLEMRIFPFASLSSQSGSSRRSRATTSAVHKNVLFPEQASGVFSAFPEFVSFQRDPPHDARNEQG